MCPIGIQGLFYVAIDYMMFHFPIENFVCHVASPLAPSKKSNLINYSFTLFSSFHFALIVRLESRTEGVSSGVSIVTLSPFLCLYSACFTRKRKQIFISISFKYQNKHLLLSPYYHVTSLKIKRPVITALSL